MNPVYPFSVLRYYPNPAFFQVGQTVSISPVPGSTSISYVITEGTLPLGLSLNATTGVISGTPTELTAASTLTIVGTLPDTITVTCSVIVTITDIPVLAPVSNQSSATDLTALRQFAESNFITAAAAVIANNNQLGKFEAYFDLPAYASVIALTMYFQSLGYSFIVTTQQYNGYQLNIEPFGEFYYGYPYSLPRFIQPFGPVRYGYPQQSFVQPRVCITWYSTPVLPQYPYYPFPNN